MSRDVLVVGESLIDIVRAPGGRSRKVVGGSPANVARGLARLGIAVRFHTVLARDMRGERIAAHLAADGVDLVDASWSLDSTSSALADIGPDGAARYTFDMTWELPTEPDPGSAAAIHVGSVAAFLEPGASVLERALRRADPNTPITFDPNIRPALLADRATVAARFERLAAVADLVKLSDEDAAWLYPGDSEMTLIRRLLAAGPRVVAVTRGGSGALLASGDIVRAIAAPAVTVSDTVGAGDTFMASLIAGLVQDPCILSSPGPDTLDRIGRRAVTAAALTVQRAGADLPTAADVRAAMA